MKKQLNHTYFLHKMNALLQKEQIELPNHLLNTAIIDAFWKKVIDTLQDTVRRCNALKPKLQGVTQNLWKLRGKNYNDPDIKYPKTVHLNSASEFSSSTHKNVLISFAAGGSVGDSMWDIQYYHNSSVLSEYRDKKNPKPPLILYHHVIIPKESKIIELYCGNHCNLIHNFCEIVY